MNPSGIQVFKHSALAQLKNATEAYMCVRVF